jgi:hypothetical protein
MTLVFGWRAAVDRRIYRPVMADLALPPEPFELFEPLDLAVPFLAIGITSFLRRGYILGGSISFTVVFSVGQCGYKWLSCAKEGILLAWESCIPA